VVNDSAGEMMQCSLSHECSTLYSTSHQCRTADHAAIQHDRSLIPDKLYAQVIAVSRLHVKLLDTETS